MHTICRALAAAAAAAGLSAVTGCSGGWFPDDEASAQAPTPWTPVPTTSAAPTVTESPVAQQPRSRKRTKAAAPTSRSASQAPAADNELGLPHEVIVRLGSMADLYGYGLGPGTALDYEQATNFAYGVSVVCDSWRSGETTVQDAVDDDVMSGAPVSDARGFNRYLHTTFCPAYHAAGN
ncbi:hypothetical protein E8D34_17615 [Nocardioides sp. GY 10113]|uniref:hypothetical protein n=1 Tax=Nocardioides sp. GY 10113 TaxID=2569761 RepID=UPI0010A91F68|nr:hypothetical protein [Nocardioides sp. GY 10113]TIC81502.1 hypothetical protein E8D34_17615 [Nocardioides sp. GY 10113]